MGRLFEHRPECELGRICVWAISGGPLQVSSNEGLCEVKVSSASPLDPFYSRVSIVHGIPPNFFTVSMQWCFEHLPKHCNRSENPA